MTLLLVDRLAYFQDDPNGMKKKYLYLLLNEPKILESIENHSNSYGFAWLPWDQQVYLYAHNIQQEPVAENGLYKSFWRFNKGYSKNGLVMKSDLLKQTSFSLEGFLTKQSQEDFKNQKKGGAVSQKLLENPFLVKQLKFRFWDKVKDQNISSKQKYRCMIFMLLNNLEDVPSCKACGSKASFNASRGIFRQTCSEECKYECINNYKGTNKKYVLPSGRTVKVQGYEPEALDLILQTIDENELVISDKSIRKQIGKFFYEHKSKQKRYLPDIYIKKLNTLVEVKSSYTLMYDFEMSLSKRNAVLAAGYNFIWHVVDWDIIVDSNGIEWKPEEYYENRKTR